MVSSPTRPIEHIASYSKNSSPEELSVDLPSTFDDKYTNIRKANLIVSNTYEGRLKSNAQMPVEWTKMITRFSSLSNWK